MVTFQQEVSINSKVTSGGSWVIRRVRLVFWLFVSCLFFVYQMSSPHFYSWSLATTVYAILLGVWTVILLEVVLQPAPGSYQDNAGAVWGVLIDVLALQLLISHLGLGLGALAPVQWLVVHFVGLSIGGVPALLVALMSMTGAQLMLAADPVVSSHQGLGWTLFYSVTHLGLAVVAGRWSSVLSLAETKVEEQQSEIESLKDFRGRILDSLTVGVVTLDEAGNTVSMNPAAQLILRRSGYDLDLASNVNLQFLLPEVALPEWLHQLSGGDEAIDQVIRHQHKEQDQTAYLRIMLTRFKGLGGAMGFLVLIEDQTARRQLEAQVRQSEKLAAVGQLAAGIAHEIRNPLASISGSVQMLTQSSLQHESAENQKLLRIMSREIDRLDRLIEEFMLFVRPESMKQEWVDLNRVLRDVVEMCRLNNHLRSGVEYTTELRADYGVIGDYDRLKQAFLNICVNGVQAMQDSSDPRLEVSVWSEENKVAVRIRDSGSGILPENLSRIFEPFHTTKAKGTGLGLAITHKILEAHEAKVFVESQVNVGTTFVVEFAGQLSPRPESARLRQAG